MREVESRKIACRLETPGVVADGFYVYNPAAVLGFSPDGKLLAAGDLSGAVTLWEIPSGKPFNPGQKISAGAAVTSLAFSPDGRRLAVACEDRSLKVWEVASGGLCSELKELAAWTPCLSWSPDGKTIAFGSFVNADSALTTWEVGRPKVSNAAVAFTAVAHLAGLSGRRMARRLLPWDINTLPWTQALQREPDFTWSLPEISMNGKLAWSPDGRRIAGVADNGDVRVFDGTTRALQAILAKPAAEGPVTGANQVHYDWSPDSKPWRSATAIGDAKPSRSRYSTPAHGKVVRTFEVPGKRCGRLAFSPDGKHLTAAGGSLWSWDLASGKVTSKTEAGTGGEFDSVAYDSSDCGLLAAGATWGTAISTSKSGVTVAPL